jgi:hypothetical protein
MVERAQPTKDRTKGNPFAYPIYLLGALAGLLSFWSLAGFILYLYEVDSWNMLFEAIRQGPNRAPWPALSLEIWFYKQHGFNLNWLNWKYLQIVREMVYPYSQYLDLLLLRMFGTAAIVPPMLILCGAAICAGRVNHRRRKDLFLNVSSTYMHLMLQARFLLFSLLTFFMSFAFGSELPVLGTVPIYSTFFVFGREFYVWYSSPMLLFAILAAPAFYVSYQLASHFTREI